MSDFKPYESLSTTRIQSYVLRYAKFYLKQAGIHYNSDNAHPECDYAVVHNGPIYNGRSRLRAIAIFFDTGDKLVYAILDGYNFNYSLAHEGFDIAAKKYIQAPANALMSFTVKEFHGLPVLPGAMWKTPNRMSIPVPGYQDFLTVPGLKFSNLSVTEVSFKNPRSFYTMTPPTSISDYRPRDGRDLKPLRLKGIGTYLADGFKSATVSTR